MITIVPRKFAIVIDTDGETLIAPDTFWFVSRLKSDCVDQVLFGNFLNS